MLFITKQYYQNKEEEGFRFFKCLSFIMASRKKYSWMKLRNGSMKDYIPNHYNLGYLLVNYGREKYGDDFWTKVTTDASAYKGLFYPFQTAIKNMLE